MSEANGRGAKRAILYARVLTEEQARSGYSLAQQIEALLEYAARERYEVLEEVTDPGQSGASLERPGMDRVRDLVAGGGVSVVLAQDRDRFAREPAYHYLLGEEFREYGCTLRALSDRGDDSPEGELTDGILDQLSKYERAKIAERTRRGKHRKLRQGKLIAGYSPGYGYRYNAARDGLLVDAAQMLVVRRIFEMVARGESFYGVIKTFEREGVLSPRGQERWNRPTLRNLILSDLYRPHTFMEVAELVTSEMAATLDPNVHYGIAYYGKKQVTKRQVSEHGGGERRYRQRIKSEVRDREQWLAVPVPDSGLPRALVDAARATVENNRRPPRSGYRSWELSGLLRCSRCGYMMNTETTSGGRSRGRLYFYYRCGGCYRSKNDCDHAKHHRAEKVEAMVWEYVRDLLENPEELRADLEYMIELEREGVHRDPEHDAKMWSDKLAEVNRQRSRAQDMAIQGLLDYDELGAKLANLEETRKVAEHELVVLGNHREYIAELERDKEAVLKHYATVAPEALNSLTPEERRHIYGMLRLRAVQRPDGKIEAEVSRGPESSFSTTKSTCSSIY
jgi:site-specific DNA recombinase